jgi:hypothetical protein
VRFLAGPRRTSGSRDAHARRRLRDGRLPVDAAHAEVFDFEEFLGAVFRAFAADAAFLHAAEGGDLGRDDAFVDADDAVFEGLGDAPDAADVAAGNTGSKLPLVGGSVPPCPARGIGRLG